MRRFLKTCFIVAVNLAVFVALLVGIEAYYRTWHPTQESFADKNGLWQVFRPYVMFTTSPGVYKFWHNDFTKELYPANVVTNSLGFNDSREFSLSKPYIKAPNEKVVLFTSGSVGWGVGATATDKTVAGRMEHYLNNLQTDQKFTVVNLSMGSWIAYQQFIALQLWGQTFNPDWVVVMDGHNDAGVGCGFSQGVGNPMYFATIKSYIDAYLFSKHRPPFYRGWLENEIIKRSAAYRALTQKEPVIDTQEFDEASSETVTARRQIIPTTLGQSREMLEFYLKAQKATLNLFPNAGFILSTQPMVNDFTGYFVNVYEAASDSEEHWQALDRREQDLESYLSQYNEQPCLQKTSDPSFTYIYVNGALKLERLVADERARGRRVEYHNTGLLFPNSRSERIPYFIDAAHITDKGADILGKFYAERILANAAKAAVSKVTDNSREPHALKSGSGLSIISALYGQNCGAPPRNATHAVERACNGRDACDYVVDVEQLGDPAPGCGKSFVVEYSCGSTRLKKELPPEAGYKSKLELSCAPKATEHVAVTASPAPSTAESVVLSGLNIRAATYGGNCGVSPGNATRDLANSCNGRLDCTYVVDVDRLRDPAPACGKDFVVEYSCAPDSAVVRTGLPAEAGLKSRLELSCARPAAEQVAAPAEPAPAAVEPVVASGLNIRGATYGGNCGAPSGNATRDLANSCNGRSDCTYVVDVERLRDPAPRCGKDFVVEYSCAPDTAVVRKGLPAEAGLKSRLELSCARPSTEQVAAPSEPIPAAAEPVVASGLNIRAATYGGNCGAPTGNATKDLANSCNGRPDCKYVVDVDRLRDPAPQCGKDFTVEYSCAPDTTLVRKGLPAEAGLKSQLELSCAPRAIEQVAAPALPDPSVTEPAVVSGLNIRRATYGGNCGAPAGNATKDLANSCNGRADCKYVVDVDRLRDPAPQCGKDFAVEYSCAPDTALVRKGLPAEAGLKSQLELSCTQQATAQVAVTATPEPSTIEPIVVSGLNIRAATYGGNCGASAGNATKDLANSCNGRTDCKYVVDVDRLRDPAPHCSKDFAVEYSCAPDTALVRKGLPGEAGLKSELALSCR